jgi:prevent-host-death family protein
MDIPQWSVAEAKARLSEVLNEAQRRPQLIENRGRGVAVLVSVEEYEALMALKEQAAPRARLDAFLRLSQEIREAGGAELELPPRSSRGAPVFAPDAAGNE